jgi:single-strand DNA-binding protein
MSLCKVNLIGYIGRDAEIKYTGQGQGVCEFSLAINEKVKSSDGQTKEHTTWFRISVWGKQAERFVAYFKKGCQIYVEGNLKVTEYVNKEGKPKTALEVDAIDFRLLLAGSNQHSTPNKDGSPNVEAPFATSTN